MAEIKRYALWLRPENEARERFQALIAMLSRRYHAPLFEPHITLLGGITGADAEVTAKTTGLALEIEPFEVQLTTADYRNEYYRCLYVKAVPTNALREAHRLARRLFEPASGDEYMPHLSLLYGDFNAQEKEKILAEIGRRFDAAFRVTRLALYATEEAPDNCAGSAIGRPQAARRARAREGPRQKWRCLKTFPLMLGDECI